MNEWSLLVFKLDIHSYSNATLNNYLFRFKLSRKNKKVDAFKIIIFEKLLVLVENIIVFC